MLGQVLLATPLQGIFGVSHAVLSTRCYTYPFTCFISYLTLGFFRVQHISNSLLNHQSQARDLTEKK
jgi:hypothetical protein